MPSVKVLECPLLLTPDFKFVNKYVNAEGFKEDNDNYECIKHVFAYLPQQT
jgi:hypothetical protein